MAGPASAGGEVRLCPPLPPEEGTTYECVAPGVEGGVPKLCWQDRPAMPGTKLKVTCMSRYKAAGSGSASYLVLCTAAGAWRKSKRSFVCTLECGIPKVPELSYYILNGSAANSLEYPWNAALFAVSPSGDEAHYICGTTLISADALLTAAHCVSSGRGGPLRTSALRVVLSATSSTLDLQVGSRRAHVQTNVLVPIKSIVVHEDYNPGSYEADIALIRLLVPAPISDYVYPVCFPLYGREHEVRERIQLSAGSVGSVVGFGVDETGAVSPTLKRATLPVLSARECKRVLGFVPSTNQICAGHTTGIAVCNGDSGAGLIFEDDGPGGLHYLQGIVSHGPLDPDNRALCDSKKYAIFTRVGAFKSWIEDTLLTD